MAAKILEFKPITGAPLDKSLEAYKNWVLNYASSLSGRSPREIDEVDQEGWTQAWRGYWDHQSEPKG